MARFLFIGRDNTPAAIRPYSSSAKMNFDAVCFSYEHNHSCNVRGADYSHNTASTNWFASLGCYLVKLRFILNKNRVYKDATFPDPSQTDCHKN